jgi:hypothetical protein
MLGSRQFARKRDKITSKGQAMFFLIRAAFWLSVVILLIPADPQSGTEAPRITAIDALVAARATIADLSAFCERNPDVCVTGDAALKIFSEKAQNGVRMLYRYFDPQKGDQPGATVDKSTLSREDLLPAWHGARAKGSA